MATASALTGAFHAACFLYFLTHIPVTMIVDSQIVLPRAWYPAWATQLMDGFLADYGDPLVGGKPVWFVALVTVEVALELPFCAVAVYAYARRRNWIRLPAIVYASHVATNMVAILAELGAHAAAAATPVEARRAYALLAFYAPYAAFPLAILAFMCANPLPFGPALPMAGAKGAKNQ